MELNEVLEFTKSAIRKHLTKACVWDEGILLQAFNKIEAYQNQPSNTAMQTGAECSLCHEELIELGSNFCMECGTDLRR